MSKLKVDEIRSADRSVSSTANITLADNGNVGIGATNPSPGLGGSDVTLEIAGATSPSLTINDTGQAEKYSLYADSNDFKIGYGTTTLTTFQNDGKVGIGTSTPESRLTLPAPLYTASDTGGMIRWQNQDTDHASDACIQGYNVDGHGCEMYVGQNSYVNTGGSITRFHSTEELSGLLFGRTGDIGFYTANTSGSATARFQINNIGNIGIGITPSNVRLYIKGAGTDSSAYATFLMNSGGTNLMYVRNDGYTWAYQAWATSDRRKKKNINYINEDILPKIEKLKLAKFDYTDVETKNNYGFIAQDVEEIFPDCISDIQTEAVLYQNGDEIPEGKEIGDIMKEKDEQKNLNYNFLFSHLVKAVQELSAKVTALENK